MMELTVNLHGGSQIAMQNRCDGDCFAHDFGILSHLLTGQTTEPVLVRDANLFWFNHSPVGNNWVRISKAVSTCGFLNQADKTFWLHLAERSEVCGSRYLAWLGNLSLLLSVVSAMLRGEKLLLVHGALLEARQGGVLLCGESGVGKSTTVRRWRETGGVSYADDLVLLERCSGRIFARPLPTWSQCSESFSGLSFPINHEVPLAGILGAARATCGNEEVLPVSNADFFAQLYSSGFRFMSLIIKNLPADEQQTLLKIIRNEVDAVVKNFPPRALFAHLGGDLKETLKEFL